MIHKNKNLKLLAIGDSGVGKTSLLTRFSENSYKGNFLPTLGIDFKKRTVNLKGENVDIYLWDTAGQERYKTVTTAFYRGAHGILLVFDITDATSFEHIESWMKVIGKETSLDIDKILVGNKKDLESARVVPKETAQAFAKKHNIPFFETSARSGESVDESVLALATMSMKQTDPVPADNTSKETIKLNSETKQSTVVEEAGMGWPCCGAPRG
eukprot:TRINITY_DN392_c0_g1_i1.p1 TRINITY_DN392_c0_g1~~TRINITY_DN392_c0_g1_i1.p1  ORF type:complete len:213 (+),score=32.69 TRINITY_DN392_c0_g1_i1:61-699(+)